MNKWPLKSVVQWRKNKKTAFAIKTFDGHCYGVTQCRVLCFHGDLLWSPAPTILANIPLKHFLLQANNLMNSCQNWREGSKVISSSVISWCCTQTTLQLSFSCLPVQTVPSLVQVIRNLWRTELNLGAAICRPGVMHMAYLACSVLIQLRWTWLDL